MKSIKVCEYSRSRSFHDDLILKDQASVERSQDQWSSGFFLFLQEMSFAKINCCKNVHSEVLFLSKISFTTYKKGSIVA